MIPDIDLHVNIYALYVNLPGKRRLRVGRGPSLAFQSSRHRSYLSYSSYETNRKKRTAGTVGTDGTNKPEEPTGTGTSPRAALRRFRVVCSIGSSSNGPTWILVYPAERDPASSEPWFAASEFPVTISRIDLSMGLLLENTTIPMHPGLRGNEGSHTMKRILVLCFWLLSLCLGIV